MAIKIIPSVSFRASDTVVAKGSAQSNQQVTNNTGVSGTNSQPVRSKKTIKDRIADIAKFYTVAGEMTKGTFKAIAYGFLAGTAVAGWAWMTKTLPQAFSKGSSVKSVFANPAKSIGWKSNLLAGTAALAVAAYQLVKAKLKANQRTANVDHQLYTGHRDI